MSDDIIADILRADTENGAPVVNIGEQTTGLGFGADTSVWGNGDGFVSVPNNPSAAGAAQAIVTQDGHVKRATQTRDARWVTKAGTLEPGDRAIVSDSEAWIRLTRATNKIQIKSGDMTVTLDGDTGVVTIDGAGTIRIGENATAIDMGPGGWPTGLGAVVREGDVVTVGTAAGPITITTPSASTFGKSIVRA